MSLSIEGAVGGAWSTGTTMTLTITTTGSNEPIIVFVEQNSASVNSITSAHLTFTKRAGTVAANDISEWTALASGPLTSEVLTINFNAGVSFAEACAFGVLGSPSSNYFDTNGSIPVVSTASSNPTFSTTAANTVVFGAARAGNSSSSPGAGWTAIYAPSGGFFIAQYQVFSSAQSGTTFAGSFGAGTNGWIVDAIDAKSTSSSRLSMMRVG